ncbi:3-deoxy-D-manno-octulosonic acid transferase [Ghiorsea bivora]|uniref:3-deoxy-D-manno-octulosonic acid transferase n=1 Tax=Ghiorsea bivora TaxID=1485545 RepID=UPI001E366571|nr:3-deoxy-D-manno-octulosonic acid transferase [Ghiorsea bivora]
MHTPSKWKQHLTLQLPQVEANPIWVHACSMGEVASVAPLINRMINHQHRIHLTVVTRTGFAHAKRLFGDTITVSWLPWDLPFLMRRFIQHLQPSLLILCETEFWPGMLKTCKKRHIPIIGINTRISDRSFPKYYKTRKLWRRWLSAVTLFLAQSQIDAQRLQQIGVPTAKIKTVGNLKFAIQAPNVDANHIRQMVDPSAQRPILIIASTHADEEAQILSLLLHQWQHIQPNLLSLIVPRHPERFDDVENLLQQHAVSYTRYTQTRTGHEQVVLIDAMGVLTQLYTIADLVFIGGSLVNIGGHNPLEPAICGRGVITGKYIQNFRAVFDDMQHQGAAIIVQDKEELGAAISRLLAKTDELTQLHAQAALFMQNQNQVLDDMWHEISPYLHPRG